MMRRSDPFKLAIAYALTAMAAALASVSDVSLRRVVDHAERVARIRIESTSRATQDGTICGVLVTASTIDPLKGPRERVTFLAFGKEAIEVGRDYLAFIFESRPADRSRLAWMLPPEAIDNDYARCIDRFGLFVGSDPLMLVPFSRDRLDGDEWLFANRLSVVSGEAFDMKRLSTPPDHLVRWRLVRREIARMLQGTR